MKALLLMRHAKSSWDDSMLADFDRPLNKRGLQAARLMGDLIRKKNLKPDLVLTSSAVRAKETTRLVCEGAALTAPVVFEKRIYEAGAQRLFEVVSEIDERINCAMMVGHNPGFEAFLESLTGEARRLPTAALALVELDIREWRHVAATTGHLRWVMKPKELASGSAKN